MRTESDRSRSLVVSSSAQGELLAEIRDAGVLSAFRTYVVVLAQAYGEERPHAPSWLKRAGHWTERVKKDSAAGVQSTGIPAAVDDVVGAVADLSAASLTGAERLALAQLLLASVSASDEVLRSSPDSGSGDMTGDGSTIAADEKTHAGTGARESILDSVVCFDSTEVARILAPTSKATRSVAQKRRKAGELIGLPIGARPNYRYPAFQLDAERHKIHDVVRHANRRLHVEKDPYGAASWWLTPTELLDGTSPLEDLEAGDLTVIAVDNVLDYSRRGM
jgi:hypothetical protein